jgi:hypothetical protein
MFANALQDRYALKKTNNSASLGVGVLGSVSMPIGSSDDSMVKVASETVTSQKFYERFFTLVELFLPAEAKKAAHIEEKPKADLGVPEAKAAPAALVPTPTPTPAAEPAATPAPAAEPAPAPAEATPVTSEPVAPPAEAAPITPAPSAEPAPASTTETITPPANPDIPPPSEPIPAMPASGQ